MARYDYGLRGPSDTMRGRYRDLNNDRYARDFDPDWRMRPPTRITAAYNLDYVRPRGERRPFNPYRFGGDWNGQMMSEYEYRYPYVTQGGTRTYRGTAVPIRYDYRDYGPVYGGRYPDEL